MILGTTNIDYVCLHSNGLPNEKRADHSLRDEQICNYPRYSYAPSLRGFRFGNPLPCKTAKLTKSCQRVFVVNQNTVAFSFTFEKKNISKEIIALFLTCAHRLACKITLFTITTTPTAHPSWSKDFITK